MKVEQWIKVREQIRSWTVNENLSMNESLTVNKSWTVNESWTVNRKLNNELKFDR